MNIETKYLSKNIEAIYLFHFSASKYRAAEVGSKPDNERVSSGENASQAPGIFHFLPSLCYGACVARVSEDNVSSEFLETLLYKHPALSGDIHSHPTHPTCGTMVLNPSDMVFLRSFRIHFSSRYQEMAELRYHVPFLSTSNLRAPI